MSRLAALALICATILGAASTPASGAMEIEGVKFASRHSAGQVDLDLHCVALLRYKYVIKAYVAGLYLGRDVAAKDVLDDVPKRLELSYFWNIDGADFGPAGEKILGQNVDPQTIGRLRERLDRISALYRDVKPGDRYSLTYVPGRGTELALNGEPRGVIEGADFAEAYFRIWLGENPIDEGFRDVLLGCPDRPSQRAEAR